MKMKCIGGENEGKYFNVHEYDSKEGAVIRLPINTKTSLAYRPLEISDKITLDVEYYKVCTWNFGDLRILFLAPVDWEYERIGRYIFC